MHMRIHHVDLTSTWRPIRNNQVVGTRNQCQFVREKTGAVAIGRFLPPPSLPHPTLRTPSSSPPHYRSPFSPYCDIDEDDDYDDDGDDTSGKLPRPAREQLPG
eukprot:3592986-Pyramimonas_sp.AAC.1